MTTPETMRPAELQNAYLDAVIDATELRDRQPDAYAATMQRFADLHAEVRMRLERDWLKQSQ